MTTKLVADLTPEEHERQKEHHCRYMRRYRETNKDQQAEKAQAYYRENKERISDYNRSYNKHRIRIPADKECARLYYRNNRDRLLEQSKKYYRENKEKAGARHRARIALDDNYRLACRLRKRMSQAIHNGQKSGSAVRDLGCTIPELRAHLEAQFARGMTWDNWARDGWHIDHIIPLAAFDLTDREQFLAACHYTNLQPLWAVDNLRKGAKVPA